MGTLNVGTMTGRGREVVELMKTRRVDILCVQETRWKGNKAKELGEGYKLYYSGATIRGRNGVGIIVSEKMKQYVLEVRREGDRMMIVRVSYGEYQVNVVSAYAPQSGAPEECKEEFWEALESLIEELPGEERVIVGVDLNGHIGTSNIGVERIHGGFGVGQPNTDGERVVDFAVSFDLAIANTFFKKREEHYITYKSGGNEAQIDFIMYRRSNLGEIQNCKVIPGDHVAPQHRLVVMDIKVRNPGVGNRRFQRVIKWTSLKDNDKREQFRREVLNRIRVPEERVQDWWREISNIIRNVA